MKIEYEHAKILRRTLVAVEQVSHPVIKEKIRDSLATYAASLKPYCDHPEQAKMADGSVVCIDCGDKEVAH